MGISFVTRIRPSSTFIPLIAFVKIKSMRYLGLTAGWVPVLD